MTKQKILSRASTATKIIIGVLTISMIMSILFPQYFPISQQEAASWISSHTYDKVIFVFVQIIQVIIPPISHYFTSMLGGYVYGPIEGGTLNWVGRVIGQFIAFYLALRAGNWMRIKLGWDFSPFEKLVGGEGKGLFLRATIIFAMIALPFFPDDELSYAMGFAKFSFWVFSVITIFGHLLGSYALAFLGSGEEFKGPFFVTLASITLVTFVILVIATAKMRKKND